VRLVLGVDSSTQSTKVEARDLETGSLVASGQAPHPPTESPASEQDPNSWWSAVVDAVSQLGDDRRNVVAMSVAGQQHGLVLIDALGESVRPARLWNDTTSAPNASALVRQLGADVWAQSCGSVPVASFTIAKFAWMAEHEPESLARTERVMLPHDYLTWRLTGAHVTDRGDASGSGWFDPASSSYRVELLSAAVSDAAQWIDRLPRVLGENEPAGELTPDAAQALGLNPGILVGPGTGDNMAAALGLGLGAGDIAMSLGTSGTVYSVSTTPTADPTGLVAGFADASGLYLPLVCTLNATRVTDTVAAWLGTDAAGLSELALTAPIEPDGVVLIPYFEGERTPNLPNATGTFAGLRTSTSREVLARAAHDGVLCGLFNGLDALTAAGVDTSGKVHLIGGGARSAAYRQRCANLHGAQIAVPDADEVVATGAAVQAAAVLQGQLIPDLISKWQLGSSVSVDPTDGARGSEIRHAFSVLSG
jgi:xylulokinase